MWRREGFRRYMESSEKGFVLATNIKGLFKLPLGRDESTTDRHLSSAMLTAVSEPSVTFPPQLARCSTLSRQHFLSCLQDAHSPGDHAACHPALTPTPTSLLA